MASMAVLCGKEDKSLPAGPRRAPGARPRFRTLRFNNARMASSTIAGRRRQVHNFTASQVKASPPVRPWSLGRHTGAGAGGRVDDLGSPRAA
jgi:hypothetical protein